MVNNLSVSIDVLWTMSMISVHNSSNNKWCKYICVCFYDNKQWTNLLQYYDKIVSDDLYIRWIKSFESLGLLK